MDAAELVAKFRRHDLRLQLVAQESELRVLVQVFEFQQGLALAALAVLDLVGELLPKPAALVVHCALTERVDEVRQPITTTAGCKPVHCALTERVDEVLGWGCQLIEHRLRSRRIASSALRFRSQLFLPRINRLGRRLRQRDRHALIARSVERIGDGRRAVPHHEVKAADLLAACDDGRLEPLDAGRPHGRGALDLFGCRALFERIAPQIFENRRQRLAVELRDLVRPLLAVAASGLREHVVTPPLDSGRRLKGRSAADVAFAQDVVGGNRQRVLGHGLEK